ncbi:MAG: alpha-L-rhamnosidase C-terminal domain-containing protein, partial [Pirellulaceae bacterium]
WPTEWAPHMVFMAYAEWMHSGDAEWLKHRYESLKTKTLIHRGGDEGLVRSGELDQERHDIVDWPQKERDGFVFTEINTFVNAFHIKALKQMSEMARAVGKNNDADAFAKRFAQAKSAFQKTLFDEAAGIYRDGVGTDHSSIHANFFPLAFGLVPQDKLAGVIQWLEQKDMKCSPYAAQYFMDGLFDHGSDRKAIDLMIADGDRSWKHMVDSGTTISWEAWDLKYKPNQDWNHAWGAAPANLLPRCVLGAEPGAPGWTSALIRPRPSGLQFARGRVPTPLGPVEVDWKMDKTFKLSLSLPDGMQARVELPSVEGSTGVFVDGKAVDATKTHDRWVLDNEVTGAITIEAK